MLFTSATFWIFYLFVFFIICFNSNFTKSIKLQNITLFVSSYFFYGYWDWRFLGLILIATAQTYFFGYQIDKKTDNKKRLLIVSIFINLLLLGFFKYFNFFASELVDILPSGFSYSTLNIILPVGISFYIFQSLTYVIDIYYGRLVPEKNFINYATFVAFFPQLVAGPIERASSLLPQFNRVTKVTSKNLYLGIKIIIVGLFLKVFVADNIAMNVNGIFNNYETYNGGELLLGAIYFSVQIYGDFCGYSLIAIGVAKCIGFDLMTNFRTPYFSTSIQDFWRRWHISLSTFFRDYVYIPLGGSHGGGVTTSKNVIYTFTLSGLWHGANWTFVVWGFFHGLLLIVQRIFGLNLSRFKTIQAVMGWMVTMMSVTTLWIFFRSESIVDGIKYLTLLVTEIDFPSILNSYGLLFCFYYLLVDLILLRNNDLKKVVLGCLFVEIVILSIMLLAVTGTLNTGSQNFIYFQF